MQNANLLNKKANWLIHYCHSLSMVVLISIFSLPVHAAEQPAQVTTETEHDEEMKSPPPEQDFESSLVEAQKAYDEGRYEEGLALLSPYEITHAGQVEYDYLMGQCALEANKLNIALSALQRVLTIDPAFAAARIELARAYYSKGVQEHSRSAFEQARAEFNNVLEQKPPKNIEKSIQEYLKTIRKYLKVRHLKTSMYVELAGGFDTNVNNGPGLEHFSFYDPFYAETRHVAVDRASRRTSSSFGRATAGMQVTLPLFTRHFDLFVAGKAGTNTYEKAHYLDHDTVAGQVGAHHYGDSNKKTASINANKTAIDGRRYADEFYAQLEWAQRIGKENLLTLRFLGGDINYEQKYHSRSTNGSRLGLEWTHKNPTSDKETRQILLLTGRDDYQNCKDYCVNIYRRDLAGFRIASSRNISERSRVYRSFYFEYSGYDEKFFDLKRIDRRAEIFFGLSTQLTKNWEVRPELQVIYNNSTINLYDSIRTIGTISLRWGF